TARWTTPRAPRSPTSPARSTWNRRSVRTGSSTGPWSERCRRSRAPPAERGRPFPMDPDDSAPPPSPAPPGPGRWSRLGLATLPVLVLLLALWAIRIPYFVLQPGQAQEVGPLIHVTGHPTFQSQGHLLLTAVEFFQPNVYEGIAAWVNPHDHVVREDELLTPGQSQGQFVRQGLSQMDTSKINATVVALTHEVGYPKNHGPGALIES